MPRLMFAVCFLFVCFSFLILIPPVFMTTCEWTSVVENVPFLTGSALHSKACGGCCRAGGQLSDPVGFGRMTQLQSASDKRSCV